MKGPAEIRSNREEEVSYVVNGLKSIANDLNIPIIALSQVCRPAVNRLEKDIRPKITDLRDSGTIGQNADMILFLHRPDCTEFFDNFEDMGKTQIIIAKNNNGITGEILLFT